MAKRIYRRRPPEDLRTAIVVMKVTPKEKELLVQAARNTLRSLSDWLRLLAITELHLQEVRQQNRLTGLAGLTVEQEHPVTPSDELSGTP